MQTPTLSSKPYALSLDIDNFYRAETVELPAEELASLADGEIMVRIDKLALTSNSISYGLAGKSGLIRYLDIYPAGDGFANIPCWGYADIVLTKHPDVRVGDRVYGLLPMASHVIMEPGKPSKNGFSDMRGCRSVVPPFYNEYAYTHTEPGYAAEFENIIMMLRPLFGTSFLMQSYCEDNEFHGASRVIITSASAKTAMGFGYLMKKHFGGTIETVALTSPRNRRFVLDLNCYDSVLTYDEISDISVGDTTILFDVAGNFEVVKSLHQRLGETLSYSGSVGKTHWDSSAQRQSQDLPGPRPVFWSAPDQIAVLRDRVGSGETMRQLTAAMMDFMVAAHKWIDMTEANGPDAMLEHIKTMLDGNVTAKQGIVLRP